MGMANSYPAYGKVVGQALKSQDINNTTVNGEEIKEPWSLGRIISFLWNFGAWAATASLRCKIQGLKRSDGSTWEAINDKDGNALEITPLTELDDGGALENKVAFCGLDLSNLDATTYKSIRVTCQNEAAAAALVSCTYEIEDLYRPPGGTTDKWRDIQKAR